MNRRELLKAIAAGCMITASGLWIPGQKLISIPSPKRFGQYQFLNSGGEFLFNGEIRYSDAIYSKPMIEASDVTYLKMYLKNGAKHIVNITQGKGPFYLNIGDTINVTGLDINKELRNG